MITKTSPLWFLILCLIALSFIAFSPLFKAQFTNWDDPQHITNNTFIKNINPQNMVSIFSQSINLTYVPLSTLSFCFDYLIAKDYAPIYHIFNILLHIAVVLVLFALLLQMGFDTNICFLACLIFAIHPMHVESVAWLTQRKDVLYSLFFILSLLFYQKYSLKSHFIDYVLSLGFAILSVLSKPMAISLPLILFLFDWFNRRGFSIRLLLEKIPFIVGVGLVTLITYVQNTHSPSGSLLEKILLWNWCFIFYLKTFLMPFHLNPLYEHPIPISLSNIEYLSSLIIVPGLFFFVFRSSNRILQFAFMYYVLSIFFLLRFDVGFDTHIVADRFMYLPSLGMCVALASLGLKWVHQNKIFLFSLFLTLLFYFYQTFSMCLVWQNSTNLWSYVIKHSPSIAFAYINRANAFYLDKNYSAALVDLKKSLTLNSEKQKYLIYHNLGLINLDQNKFEDAVLEFTKTLKNNPFYKFSCFPRAQAWAELGKMNEALDDYNKAAEFDPYNYVIFNNRGNILKTLNRPDSALNDFNRSVWLNPNYALGFYNRGNLYKDLKEYSLAVNDYSKSLLLNPGFVESLLNRGICYSGLGLFDLAEADFNKVLQLNPQNPDAHRNLSILSEVREQNLKLNY